jgi:uncharacterized Zn finger protein (UPF0148 family)
MGLFGGEARDRARVLAVVPTTGATNVDQLAAELRWPRDRAVRAVERLSAGSSGITYDPTSGAVQHASPEARGPKEAPVASPQVPPPAISAESLRPGLCPDCRTPLTSAGSPGTFYCSSCGTLETRGSRVAAPPGTARAPTPSSPSAAFAGDRRTQELFAAWVTSSPILCPRCRQPLSHRGVESYACPACGEKVTFGESGVSTVEPPGT